MPIYLYHFHHSAKLKCAVQPLNSPTCSPDSLQSTVARVQAKQILYHFDPSPRNYRSSRRMNGNKGSSIAIDINLRSNVAAEPGAQTKRSQACSEQADAGSSSRKWIRDVWEFGKEDTNRVTFALKVGLAVLLVSLLILFRAPFEVFGTNIIWSILTVAIMFEYTVGMYLRT